MRRLVLLLSAAALTAAAASDKKEKPHGSFTPVIAKQRLTYSSEQLNGSERVLSTYQGVYLRASNGSELATLGPVVNGTFSGASEGRLRIARDGTTYKLDFKKKTATLVATETVPLAPHSYPAMKDDKPAKAKPQKSKSGPKDKGKSTVPDALEENQGDFAGFENINGFKCAGLVVRNHGSQTGTRWVDLKHDLLVRLETIFGSNDDHVLIALERFEIDTRQEPEAGLFELPGGWTVIAPTVVPPETSPTPRQAKP